MSPDQKGGRPRHLGDVDFPVIRRGRKFIAPTAAILSLLGLADAPPEATTDRRALRAVPPREVA